MVINPIKCIKQYQGSLYKISIKWFTTASKIEHSWHSEIRPLVKIATIKQLRIKNR